MCSMLGNLLRNAIEASASHSEVTVQVIDSPTPQVSIHNHGVIPPQVRDTLFNKYVTVDRQRNGTGHLLGVPDGDCTGR